MNNSPSPIRSGIMGVFGFIIFIAIAIAFLTLQSRHKALEDALRAQLEERDQTIKILQSHSPNTGGSTGVIESDSNRPSATSSHGSSVEIELCRRLADLTQLQSNMLVLVERLANQTAPGAVAGSGVYSDATAKTAQAAVTVKEAFLAQYQQDFETAKQNEDKFLQMYAVPADIANTDTRTALGMDSLKQFRPYFEAKRDREIAQIRIERMTRELERTKINAGIEAAVGAGK